MKRRFNHLRFEELELSHSLYDALSEIYRIQSLTNKFRYRFIDIEESAILNVILTKEQLIERKYERTLELEIDLNESYSPIG